MFLYLVATRGSSPEVKKVKHEADCLLPCSANIKNVWCYNIITQYIFKDWCLITIGMC
jgi:hypothetical protein